MASHGPLKMKMKMKFLWRLALWSSYASEQLDLLHAKSFTGELLASKNHFCGGDVSVPDRRRRIISEVVLVRRWVIGVLGIWRGEGLGEGLGQGRSVYKQPETEVDGSCHS